MSKVRRRSSRLRHKRRQRSMQGESLENRLLLASDWQNFSAPLDVNHDETVSPADVLSVVNDLNEHGARELTEISEGEAGGSRPLSVDVNGDGSVSPGDALAVVNFLNAEGETGAVMQYRIGIFDADGVEEITTVGLDEEFVVRVFVSDIRMSGRAGVFSAYLDIDYEAALASVVPNAFLQLDLNTFETVPVTVMDNQDNYGNGRSGDFSTTPGVVDGVGSFSGSTLPLGPTERELFKIKFRADAEGTVNFIGSPTTEAVGDPGQSPTLDTGLYNSDNPVCPSSAIDNETGEDLCRGDMMFINDSITIVSDIVAVDDELTVDEDSGASSAIDVLANDIVNIGSLNLESFTQTANGALVQNSNGTFTYTPNANFFGSDSFSYTVNNGQGATSSATVDITVNPINDAPVNAVPGGQVVDEDGALAVSGLSVADVDADAGTGLQVSLSVSSGILTVGDSSASVSGDGSGLVTVEGAVAAVNAALSGLSYEPNADFNGSDTLGITTSDLGNFGAGGTLSDTDTVSITINPVNDAPINTVPGPQTVFNTETLSFSAGQFQVVDVDAAMIEVSITVNLGTVSIGDSGNLQLSGNNSDSLTVTGTVSAVNSGLGSLVYDPQDGVIDVDTLTMTTSDLGGTGSGGVLTDVDTVSISVTPPETPFAAGDLFTIDEDPSADLTFNLADLLSNDLAPEGDNSLSLTQINGQAPDAGPFQTAGSGTLSFDTGTGSFAYRPAVNFFGSDTFTYTIESSPEVGDGPSTGTVEIRVQSINDGPINNVPGPLSVDEDSSLSFSGTVSVTDVDAGDGTVTVSLSVANGNLNVPTTSGVSITGNGSTAIVLDGTVTGLNSALGGLSYAPTPDFAGLDSLSISTTDNGNTGGISGDPNASNPLTAEDSVDITIQPINDAPLLVVPGAQVFITDFDNVFSTANGNAIRVSDIDAGDDDVQVSLSIGAGALTVADSSLVAGNGTNSLLFSGSIADINAVLAAGVNYRVGDTGNQTLSVSVDDLGNNGGVAGDPNAVNPLTAADTVAIEVFDFVPSTVGGYVFIDGNEDGHRGTGDGGLAGVEVQLSGTDGITGATIDTISVFSDSTGRYEFANLRPGSYLLQKVHPGQFIDGADQFSSPVTAVGADRGSLEIDIRGGVNSVANDFAILGLNGMFFDGFDLQTPSQAGGELYNNLLFAIDGTDPTSPRTIVQYQGDHWAGYTNAQIRMSADGQSVTVMMLETATSTLKSATFSFDSARFRTRSMGALSTIRVFFTPDMLSTAGVADTARFAAAVDQVLAE